VIIREAHVESVDDQGLLAVSTREDAVLFLHVRPGDHVISGCRLAAAVPRLSSVGMRRVADAFAVGRQRTTHQDVEFAFMQLAEIAIRALSPGVSDPFTAMMCLNRITTAMTALADRGLPASHRYDPKGALRVVARPYGHADLVQAAFGYIGEHAGLYPSVREHLRRCISLVLDRVTDPELRHALQRLLPIS
jgi:uncharacterized membrane protein